MGGGRRQLLQVVGHQDGREAWLRRGQGREGRQQRFPGRQIEAGGWFVEQQKGRCGHQGTGDSDSLPLTLGAGGHLALGKIGAAQ